LNEDLQTINNHSELDLLVKSLIAVAVKLFDARIAASSI